MYLARGPYEQQISTRASVCNFSTHVPLRDPIRSCSSPLAVSRSHHAPCSIVGRRHGFGEDVARPARCSGGTCLGIEVGRWRLLDISSRRRRCSAIMELQSRGRYIPSPSDECCAHDVWLVGGGGEEMSLSAMPLVELNGRSTRKMPESRAVTEMGKARAFLLHLFFLIDNDMTTSQFIAALITVESTNSRRTARKPD